MSGFTRRSLVVGSTALVGSSVLASIGGVGADDGDGDPALELSVRADDSTHVDRGITSFRAEVTNLGDDPVSVSVALEIAHVDEELETLELGPGETGSARKSFDPRSLRPGEHEWTVAAGGETETGTLPVEAGDDYEDRDEGFHLDVHWDDETVIAVDDCRETLPLGFDVTVLNYRYDAVETTLTFEIDDETDEIPLEFEPRESKHAYTRRELGVGRYEWTATLGDRTRTGRIRIVHQASEN